MNMTETLPTVETRVKITVLPADLIGQFISNASNFELELIKLNYLLLRYSNVTLNHSCPSNKWNVSLEELDCFNIEIHV